MSSESQLPVDPPQRQRTCRVPGCSNAATGTRDRLMHEIKTGTAQYATWDLCDEHARQFDADPDAFVRRIASA
jgi:hypothetical protein